MATVAAVAFVVVGCGTSPGNISVPASEPPAEASQPGPEAASDAPARVGTGGELISIQSDNVQAAGYDDATRTMSVLFDSGGLYEYYDVPSSLWVDFVAAQPHPWSAVGYPELVQGGIAYERIG
jgi:hypothetical protein